MIRAHKLFLDEIPSRKSFKIVTTSQTKSTKGNISNMNEEMPKSAEKQETKECIDNKPLQIALLPGQTYKCNQCELKFAQMTSLVVHLANHTGEKPFACDECENKFTHKNNLIEHMRTHTGEKPFKCDLCTSKFSRKFSLFNHMRTHTGEKPFSCDKCGKSFAQKSNFTRHLKKIHANLNKN